MKKGEFSRFLFKPRYAYGDFGCPPHIPPLATVLYEVQVLDFFDSAQVDEFMDLTTVRINVLILYFILFTLNDMDFVTETLIKCECLCECCALI